MMRIGMATGALALAAAVSAAHAQQAIFGTFGTPNNRTDGGKVVGISLTGNGQTISSLGFFDYLQDGIADTYQLGIWDSSQTLVGTATVTPGSPLIGDFRWANLGSPVTLGTPESFTIGVLLQQNQQDVWWDGVNLSLGAGYGGAGTGQFSGPSAVLTHPGNLDSSPYYVVNAGGPVAVPEPVTAAALGVAALVLLRRRDHSR